MKDLLFDSSNLIGWISTTLGFIGVLLSVIGFYFSNSKSKKKSESDFNIGDDASFDDIFNSIKDDELRKQIEDTISTPEINKGPITEWNDPNLIKICDSILKNRITDREALYRVFSNIRDNKGIKYKAFLSTFYAWLALGPSIEIDGAKIDNDDLLKIQNLISGFIEEEKDAIIFDEVSQDDKSCLLSIKSMAKDSRNCYAINRDIYRLANSIKNNQKKIKRERILNLAALSASVLSLIATVFFSISSNITVKERINEIKVDNKEQIHSVIDSISHIINDNSKMPK